MKRWKQDIRGIGGLNYILFKGVPMRESKYGKERLHSINEVAVRAFFAEKLGIEISGNLSQLVGSASAPEELVLKAG